MKKFTLFVRMFDDIYDDGRFVFEATDQKEAQKKGNKWARYQGISSQDIKVKESEGNELNWTVNNESVE